MNIDLQALQLNLEDLRIKLKKPLRSFWVTQDLTPNFFPTKPSPSSSPRIFPDYHPIICLTASRRINAASEVSLGGYIQGAGDDSEGWSHGLTPALFWAHKNQLLSTAEGDLPALISELLAIEQQQQQQQNVSPASCNARKESIKPPPSVLISPTKSIYITALRNMDEAQAASRNFDSVIFCGPDPNPKSLSAATSTNLLHLPCGLGKAGSRALHAHLPSIQPFIHAIHQRLTRINNDNVVNASPSPSPLPPPRILFACPTGQDLAIGAALTILCLDFTNEGTFSPFLSSSSSPLMKRKTNMEIDTPIITKDFVKQRLSWIMASKPDGNPSRKTLQVVNEFLMGGEWRVQGRGRGRSAGGGSRGGIGKGENRSGNGGIEEGVEGGEGAR